MEKLYCADNLDGTYNNPILFADYSDPDVIRVGDTFYMTASSFNYIPGLPILISKDLVNWELANYALDKIEYEDYELPQHARGVWAPAIRFHEGSFYIYYGMPDEGIFMVKTDDPLGKWEEPVLVLEGKGLIDPCPFWDVDRAYVVHGYAKSRIGFKSVLGLFEMSLDGKRAIGPDHILYDGQETNPTIEGPKVYKKADFYYIFAPAGGVKTGWQTVLRSKSIQGPFDERVVLESKDTSINGPHQGALVDTQNGDEWFLHFQDRGMYGRITHLQPVSWDEGWPVIGDAGAPVLTYRKPSVDAGGNLQLSLEASDDFETERLKLIWQWTGNSREEFYSLGANPGHLRLFALNTSGDVKPIVWRSSNILTQKIVCPYFKSTISFDASNLKDGDKAGVAMIGGEYAYLAIRRSRERFLLVYGLSSEVSGQLSNGPGLKTEKEQVLEELSPVETDDFIVNIYLESEHEKPVFHFSYSKNGKETVVEESFNFLPADHTWVGAKIGIFALGTGVGGYADYLYVHSTKI